MVDRKTGLAPVVVNEDCATATVRAARQLRDEILEIAQEGVFLGSEEELMTRLAVSRATFRQAARVLEQEELLTIRRGVGGGFFTRSPSADAVAHMAAVYLTFKRTPVADVLRASKVMRVEAVRRIAASQGPEQRAVLREFLDTNAGFEHWSDRRSSVRVVNGFHNLVASLSGNGALELFMNVVRMFGNRAGSLGFTSKRLEAYAKVIRELAAAIEAGDADAAEALVHHELDITLLWLGKGRG
jgi:DNA-binding FadR family transcriptional regulator